MTSTLRRVVVTGLGCTSPIGVTAQDTWDALLAGKSGIKPLTAFDASDYKVRICGEIRDFDPTVAIPMNKAKKLDRFVALGIVAAHECMKDAGLGPMSEDEAELASVIAGSGIGGLIETEAQHTKLLAKGPSRVSPFLIPKLMLNALAAQMSMAFNFKGVNFATASACASAGHAIAMAMRSIKIGESNLVMTGGGEACITTLGMSGFASLKAMSTRNDEPELASRPFDRDRDGFVMGEGAGVLLLEELEHAKKRGAKIYCEIVGAGMTGDAHHITQPAPNAEGAQRSMKLAMREGGLNLDDVDYVNAHGTSTPINDVNESGAIEAVFGDHAKNMVVNSTKSMIGHLLGASAAVESVVTVMSIANGAVHQTLNHDNPGEGCNLDYVKGAARDRNIRAALTNSLGFGGHNLTLAFKRFED